MKPSGDEVAGRCGHSEGDGNFMPEESHSLCDLSLTAQDNETKHVIVSERETIQSIDNQNQFQGKIDSLCETSCPPLEGGEFADGRSKTSPDSEQIEYTVAKQHVRNSESVEQIQDRPKSMISRWGKINCHVKGNDNLSLNNFVEDIPLTCTPKVRICSLRITSSPRWGEEFLDARWKNSRKIAFTEPSRGMSGAKVEQTSAETLSFRCVCERCCLTRGEVNNENRKVAFTLAEVLITLGIIGVVAALTIPTIIQNYKKSVIETSVKRFYTTMNQAIILSERENGDMHNWSRTPWSGDGAPTWDKYFDKYVVTVERKKTNDGRNTIFVFPDGSGLIIHTSDFFYCTKADLIYKNDMNTSNPQCMLFGFYPNYPVNEPDCVVATYRNKGIEPYINGSVDCSKINDTKTLCEYYHYYGRVLQISGWKFPKDCKVKL